MKQEIEKVVLKNGLTIIFLFDKRYTTSTLQITFPLGWRQDPPDKIGLAHFFEHLIGKRTVSHPEKSQFAKKLSILGIKTNATTTPISTVYFQNQITTNLLPSLELLLDAVYCSVFDVEDLEKEKEVVLTEARQHKDADIPTTWHNAAKNLYSYSTLSRFFFGNEESLKNISVGSFTEFYKIYKNPKNATLLVAVNDKKYKKEILTCLESFYSKFKNETSADIPNLQDTFEKIIPFSNLKKEGKNQASICVAFRGENLNIKESVILDILNKILLHHLVGKLMLKLRDQLGLIYGMQLHNINFKDTSMVYFNTNTKKENSKIVEENLLEELEVLANSLIQKDITDVQNVILYEVETGINSYNDMFFVNKTYLSNAEFVTTEEYIRILKNIKVEEVRSLMRKVFNPGNKTVVILD